MAYCPKAHTQIEIRLASFFVSIVSRCLATSTVVCAALRARERERERQSEKEIHSQVKCKSVVRRNKIFRSLKFCENPSANMQGSMEGQQFCLRWHNFQNTLLSSLPKLLDGGYLTDVTLSAGGRHIRAHKIILSACSYYFKELFKDLSSLQHPVIVLPGMEYANLCALVTFMYNGEVNIYQEQLPALLAMADTLHIRGLADIAGVT